MDDLRTLLRDADPVPPVLDLEKLRTRILRRREARTRRRFAILFAVAAVAVPVVVTATTDSPPRSNIATDPGPTPTAQSMTTVPAASPPPAATAHVVLGPEVVVGEGTIGGRSWQLLAYDSTDGFCVELRTSPFGGSAGCGGAPGDRVFSNATTWQPGVLQAMYGQVRADVSRIEAVLDSGEVLTTTPIGSEAGFPVNFYIIEIPLDALVTEVACYDAEGTQISVVTKYPELLERERQAFLDTTTRLEGVIR